MKPISTIVLSSLLIIATAVSAWAGHIGISGSTTVQPAAEKLAAAFMAEHPDVSIKVDGGGSGNGIKAIIDGTSDIGNASRFIKTNELDMATGQKIYPIPFRIAYDCLVPIVHPTNPVNNLSIDQLREIYQGKIINWKAVGGKDRPIKLISRDMSSGTYEVWDEKVMKKVNVFPGAHLLDSAGEVMKAVAADADAIGYVGLGNLSSSVKDLMVNRVKGAEETTISGAFPISRPLFMFTQGWPSGDTLNFINYVLDPGKGQVQVKNAGYVPLYASVGNRPAAPAVPAAAAFSQTEDMNTIKMVQRYLNALNYNAGSVDGLKGPRTVSAMTAFQKTNNLPVNVAVTDDFIARLTQRYNESTGRM
jgi:phosphate transport system substrate-binding protein